jgi:hypothetical protein
MWPYLVGVASHSEAHLEQVESRLACLNPQRIIPGVWLIHSDYSIEALYTALRTLLDDSAVFFAVSVGEDFVTHNLRRVKL